MTLKLSSDLDQAKSLIRWLVFSLADCLKMPLIPSLSTTFSTTSWQASTFNLKLLRQLIIDCQSAFKESDEALAIRLIIECQLEKEQLSSSM
jgi:hypothetical protein